MFDRPFFLDYIGFENDPPIYEDDYPEQKLVRWQYGSLVPVTADSEPITVDQNRLDRWQDEQNAVNPCDDWNFSFWVWNYFAGKGVDRSAMVIQ